MRTYASYSVGMDSLTGAVASSSRSAALCEESSRGKVSVGA